MANLLEDGVNFGFGLFAYSREKIEKMVNNLVDQGKIERKDAQSFAHNMIQTGEEQRQEVRKMIQEQVKSDLQGMGIVPENQAKPLTAEDIRQIVREELASSKGDSASK